jgi:hypothetical protein
MPYIDEAVDDVLRPALDAGTQLIDAAQFQDKLDEASSLLREGIPPSALHERELSAWEILLVGWLEEKPTNDDEDPDGFGLQRLVATSGNRDLSRLLVKTLELASIATLWSDSDRASS